MKFVSFVSDQKKLLFLRAHLFLWFGSVAASVQSNIYVMTFPVQFVWHPTTSWLAFTTLIAATIPFTVTDFYCNSRNMASDMCLVHELRTFCVILKKMYFYLLGSYAFHKLHLLFTKG